MITHHGVSAVASVAEQVFDECLYWKVGVDSDRIRAHQIRDQYFVERLCRDRADVLNACRLSNEPADRHAPDTTDKSAERDLDNS